MESKTYKLKELYVRKYINRKTQKQQKYNRG